MSVTEILTNFVVSTRFDDLPRNVVEDTKRVILDSIGCAVGAFSLPFGRKFSNLFKSFGGCSESTIIGDGGKIPSIHAACVNTKLANLMDMDDVFWNIGHPSPIVIHSALSLGEKIGAAGKDIITAVSIGFDIGARISLSIGTIFELIDGRVEYVVDGPCGFGQEILGGVAAASKILGLDPEEMRNAFGIAALYAPPPLARKTTMDITNSKYQLEWSSMGAVLSSLFAKQKITGPCSILDDNYFAQSMGLKDYNADFLTKDLGKKWYITETSIKPYPCCRHIHYALDLFEKIIQEEGLYPGEISKVTAKGLGRLTLWPWNNKSPKDEFWAQFSLPYNMAMIAHRISPGPEWLNDKRISDPRIQSFSEKIFIEPHPKSNDMLREGIPDSFTKRPTIVEVLARDRIFSRETDVAKGDGWSLEARMSDEEVIEKFKTNTLDVLGDKKTELLLKRILSLENINDLSSITELFS